MGFLRNEEGKLKWACLFWIYAGIMLSLRGISEHDAILGAAGITGFIIATGKGLRCQWANWVALLLIVTLFLVGLHNHSARLAEVHRQEEESRRAVIKRPDQR